MKTKIIFLIVTAVLLVFNAASADRVIDEWSYLYDGIWSAVGTDDSPRLMNAYALRVDLSNPNITFKVTNTNGDDSLDTAVKSTPLFLERNNLEVAINANFFARTGSNADVLGVLRRNNVLISAGLSTYPAQLRINDENVASIVNGTGDASGVKTVIAGDTWNLVNGSASGDNTEVSARTGAGISQDGRFLILLVIDGSQGATKLELANWLRDFGAYNGLNLASGDASCMVRSEHVDGPPIVINSPNAGSPIKVGCNLGVNSFERAARQDIFIVGGTGNINHRFCVEDGTWTDWVNLGAPAIGLASTAGPAAVSRIPGHIGLYCVGGTDRNLYHKYYSAGAWSTSWINLGNGTLSGNPDVCSWGHDRVDIFCRNTSNNLMQLTWTAAGGWGNWVNLGGSLGSGPSAVSWGAGRIDVFARSTSNTLMQKTYSNGSWGSWVDLGDAMVGVPDACARVKNKIDVFFRTGSGTIKVRRYRGPLAGWILAMDIAGSASGDPGAVSHDPDVITVYVPRSDGNVWSRQWRNHSNWMKWECVGSNLGTNGGGVDASSWTNDAGTHQ